MIFEIFDPSKILHRSLSVGLETAIACFIILVVCSGAHCSDGEPRFTLPRADAKILEASGEIEASEVSESSGLIKSRRWPDVFWTHNDSSNEPKIFAMRNDGSCVKPSTGSNCAGIEVAGAKNVDWESIAADDSGNLIVADLGDNKNKRKDLALYVFKEPNPYSAQRSEKAVKIRVSYPDRPKIPPEKMNFDCEAVVWTGGKIFVLTKHRSDDFTKLYRLESMNPSDVNRLILVDRFPIAGSVTGADLSADGGRLAVLTYGAIWLFEEFGESESLLKGKVRWLPIEAGQCEGIAFDGDKLIITNERRQVFEVPIESLLTVRE